MAILNFVKPGAFVVGTIVGVNTESVTFKKGTPQERQAEKLVTTFISDDGQTYTAEHFMSDFDAIQTAYAQIGINIETDTDTWFNTRASLEIVDPRFGRVEITGPAGNTQVSNTGLSTAQAVVPVQPLAPGELVKPIAQPVTPVQQTVAPVQQTVAPVAPVAQPVVPQATMGSEDLPGLGS